MDFCLICIRKAEVQCLSLFYWRTFSNSGMPYYGILMNRYAVFQCFMCLFKRLRVAFKGYCYCLELIFGLWLWRTVASGLINTASVTFFASSSAVLSLFCSIALKCFVYFWRVLNGLTWSWCILWNWKLFILVYPSKLEGGVVSFNFSATFCPSGPPKVDTV